MSSGYGSTWDAKQDRIRERRAAAKRLLEGGRAYRDGAHSEQGDLQAVADDYLVLTAEPMSERVDWSVALRNLGWCIDAIQSSPVLMAELQKQHADQPAESAAEGREFMACDVCRLGSGTNVLCQGCLTNRTTIAALRGELAKLRAERDAFSLKAGEWRNLAELVEVRAKGAEQRAESAERAAAELRQRVAELVELLLRLDGWDHMQASADGCYWQGEIRKAVQSANECAMRVAELEAKGGG